jgi:hypothetical protein
MVAQHDAALLFREVAGSDPSKAQEAYLACGKAFLPPASKAKQGAKEKIAA